MTQDDVIEMAIQAGMVQDCCDMWFSPGKGDMDVEHEHLEAFAKLVAAKATASEREACAKVVEDSLWFTRLVVAKAIRARDQGTPERGQA
jgi:hypothetical protein